MSKKIMTSVCELLGLTIPIFQGPMGGVTTPELVSAVANTGGLGVLPLGKWTLDNCERFIDEALAMTMRPIAVNLILEWQQQERFELALQKGIKYFWFFWGDPEPYIKQVHDIDGKVILTVGSAEEAKRAVEIGVDVVVTQGWEAGGHVWGQVATMPLVPAVVDAVAGKVPVVAAGGIADGRGLAAALALGAEAVVMGTRLLCSVEASAHDQYKQRIMSASEQDTVFTQLFDKGWPNSNMRVLKNSTYAAWQAAGQPASGARPGENDIITELHPDHQIERYSMYLPARVMQGNLEPLAHYSGQSAGIVSEVKPVSDILDETVTEAIAEIKRMHNLVA